MNQEHMGLELSLTKQMKHAQWMIVNQMELGLDAHTMNDNHN